MRLFKEGWPMSPVAELRGVFDELQSVAVFSDATRW
jgi:hypothetical protein